MSGRRTQNSAISGHCLTRFGHMLVRVAQAGPLQKSTKLGRCGQNVDPPCTALTKTNMLQVSACFGVTFWGNCNFGAPAAISQICWNLAKFGPTRANLVDSGPDSAEIKAAARAVRWPACWLPCPAPPQDRPPRICVQPIQRLIRVNHGKTPAMVQELKQNKR